MCGLVELFYVNSANKFLLYYIILPYHIIVFVSYYKLNYMMWNLLVYSYYSYSIIVSSHRQTG